MTDQTEPQIPAQKNRAFDANIARIQNIIQVSTSIAGVICIIVIIIGAATGKRNIILIGIGSLLLSVGIIIGGLYYLDMRKKDRPQ